MEKIAESGNDRLLPGAAARILGVTTKTLSSMNQLHPIILPSGHRRYIRSDVEALLTSPAESSPEADSTGDAA